MHHQMANLICRAAYGEERNVAARSEGGGGELAPATEAGARSGVCPRRKPAGA
jgi:hypothetical protein